MHCLMDLVFKAIVKLIVYVVNAKLISLYVFNVELHWIEFSNFLKASVYVKMDIMKILRQKHAFHVLMAVLNVLPQLNALTV